MLWESCQMPRKLKSLEQLALFSDGQDTNWPFKI